MGWDHFLGGRPGGPSKDTNPNHGQYFNWNNDYDYTSYQHHFGQRTNTDVYNVFRDCFNAGQPTSLSSQRIEHGSEQDQRMWMAPQTRDFLWASTMAGGVAGIWGTGSLEAPRFQAEASQRRMEIKTYSTFFFEKKRFLADMVVANNLSNSSNARVLRSQGSDAYVLYRENANSIQVNLSGASGPLSAIAVDTKGSYSEISLGTLSASSQTINLPRTSNWAVDR